MAFVRDTRNQNISIGTLVFFSSSHLKEKHIFLVRSEANFIESYHVFLCVYIPVECLNDTKNT